MREVRSIMSISPLSSISSLLSSAQGSQGTQNNQRQQDFSELANALQSGDLSEAQQAYAALESAYRRPLDGPECDLPLRWSTE